MDLSSVAFQASPSEQPKKIAMTLNGTALEFTALRDALDKALTGLAPVVFEYTTSLGVPVRVMIDRVGPPIAGN